LLLDSKRLNKMMKKVIFIFKENGKQTKKNTPN